MISHNNAMYGSQPNSWVSGTGPIIGQSQVMSASNNYQKPVLIGQTQNTGYPDPPDGPQIPARIFCQESNLRPNEVPPDGTLSAFIKQDCSCIYLKQVNQRGLIDEVKYIRETTSEPETNQETNGEIAVGFSEIMQRLDKIEKSLSYRQPYKYQKSHTRKFENDNKEIEKSENKRSVAE